MKFRHLIREELNKNLEFNSKFQLNHAEKPFPCSLNSEITQILEGIHISVLLSHITPVLLL